MVNFFNFSAYQVFGWLFRPPPAASASASCSNLCEDFGKLWRVDLAVHLRATKWLNFGHLSLGHLEIWPCHQRSECHAFEMQLRESLLELLQLERQLLRLPVAPQLCTAGTAPATEVLGLRIWRNCSWAAGLPNDNWGPRVLRSLAGKLASE